MTDKDGIDLEARLFVVAAILGYTPARLSSVVNLSEIIII